jgi:hypothetical protein
MIVAVPTPLVMTEGTDPVENANFHAQMARFQKNSDWLEAHIPEVYSQHRGRCICIAGQELFVADTGSEVMALARQAHPEDDGPLLVQIPRERMERIYAHLRALGSQ